MRGARAELLGGVAFAGLPFDAALRLMLTRAGFRLPGEAQKIDRITQAFARAFTADNPQPGAGAGGGGRAGGEAGSSGPRPSVAMADGRLFPGSPDVVEILAFSCIMLNTDAHNPSIKVRRPPPPLLLLRPV